MIVCAPASRATATALMPSPPAPWMTTECPARRPARRSPYSTWDSAQFAGVATSSEISSGILNT
jgi:hypothetical protein